MTPKDTAPKTPPAHEQRQEETLFRQLLRVFSVIFRPRIQRDIETMEKDAEVRKASKEQEKV